MTKILLFDLDDTLIGNPMDTFVQQYSQALAKCLAPARQDDLIRELFKATRSMVQNIEADRTLEHEFDHSFYPGLHTSRGVMQPDIDSFYAYEFPKLKNGTTYKPDALTTINAALDRGWCIALATNPLFPQTAIRQRLDWAGLAADQFPWLVIPSYENFHFSKPHKEFYAELLGQIGWPELPIVMVGNDIEMDIKPAQELGLATYYVGNHADGDRLPSSNRHGHGKLQDLINWLDQQNCTDLKLHEPSPQSNLAVLRSTIASLDTLTRNLAPEVWSRRISLQEWCLTEIICHLRDVEAEVNLPRIYQMLNEKDPFITGKNTDVWAQERRYFEQDGPQAFKSFTQVRLKLIGVLENLENEKWGLTARHSIFGPIQIAELVRITASHDKLHLQTVFELVRKQTCQER